MTSRRRSVDTDARAGDGRGTWCAREIPRGPNANISIRSIHMRVERHREITIDIYMNVYGKLVYGATPYIEECICISTYVPVRSWPRIFHRRK